MKHFGDLIQTGLLGLMGQDETSSMESYSWTTPEGGPPPYAFRSAGNRLEISRTAPARQSAPAMPLPVAPHALWNPPTSPTPFMHNAVWNPAQQADYPVQILAAEQGPNGQRQSGTANQMLYYRIGERPLEGLKGIYNLLTGNNNLRSRHQHFIRNDGKNFGFGKEGLFMENEKNLQDYEFGTPDYGQRKMKADYIEQARQEIDILLKTRQRLLDEANRRTPLSYGMTEHTIYNVLGFNCQEYVDIVIKKAQELARQNGKSLFID